MLQNMDSNMIMRKLVLLEIFFHMFCIFPAPGDTLSRIPQDQKGDGRRRFGPGEFWADLPKHRLRRSGQLSPAKLHHWGQNALVSIHVQVVHTENNLLLETTSISLQFLNNKNLCAGLASTWSWYFWTSKCRRWRVSNPKTWLRRLFTSTFMPRTWFHFEMSTSHVSASALIQ